MAAPTPLKPVLILSKSKSLKPCPNKLKPELIFSTPLPCKDFVVSLRSSILSFSSATLLAALPSPFKAAD